MNAVVGKCKETIHSGQFMVSQFEADEQDDEYELAVPVPEEGTDAKNRPVSVQTIVKKTFPQQLTIDTSLSKLFQCMTIAYRQKLTSPKWNRFRGIRLRWKDKIRLNNVIWRCWHMQFIKKINTLICQFASPLDVDTHNKPEAIVLEGKYWKRKLAAVTAEYKKWRMYYRNNVYGHNRDAIETLSDLDALNWHSHSNDVHMMVDEDYLGLMSDTLFSTIANQPFVFPDSREIAKAGLADFIQPSLGPLQPNLDDYMDTFEPLQEFISSSKLPSVPEENGADVSFKQENINWCYPDLILMPDSTSLTTNHRLLASSNLMQQPYSSIDMQKDSNAIQRTSLENYVPPGMLSLQYSVTSAAQPLNQVYEQSLAPFETQTTKALKVPTTDQSVFNTYTAISSPSSTQSQQQSIPTNTMVNFSLESESNAYRFAAANVSSLTPHQESSSALPSRNMLQQSKAKAAAIVSLDSCDHPLPQKESRNERKPRTVGRQRSISVSREPVKRPPLLSAVSDPQLVTPTNSVLLTQLLTGGSQTNLYSSNQNVDQSQSNVRVKEEKGALSSATTAQVPSTSSDSLINLNSPTSSYGSHGTVSSCPTSPQENLGSPGREQKDQRRVGHIHAEQKRRYNIKNGFDMIHSLIPHLNQNFNAKLSKAAMLQKGAEYIRQLQLERKQLKEEMNSLQHQIETLNASISNCQSMLPSTGAPVSRKRDDKMQQMFDDFVRKKTVEDWRFWIFSLLFKPLLISFNNFVSTSSLDDLYRTTLQWIEQHCSLHDLRPIVLNSLRYLCTKTDILSAPEKLADEARQAVEVQRSHQS